SLSGMTPELTFLAVPASALLAAFIYANLPTSYTIGHVKPTIADLKKARVVKIDKERSVDRSKTISADEFLSQPSLVLAVRRPGCILCRREAEHLSKLKTLLDKAGIRLVAVTHQLKGVDAFKPHFDGDVYLDTQRTFFGPHGRWMPIWIGLLRVNLWWYTLLSVKEGLWGDLRGEGRLLGGVYLIADNVLEWSFLEKEWGDKPRIREVKGAVEKFA
ncbi:hypothetical protein PENTCL1PPCAC_12158, partial [Pristionchus entomophagus]